MYKPFDSFRPAGRLISVIGSGGKTTFLRYLADRLPGTVILTTSTHIWPFPDIPLVNAADAEVIMTNCEYKNTLTGKKVVDGKLLIPAYTCLELRF